VSEWTAIVRRSIAEYIRRIEREQAVTLAAFRAHGLPQRVVAHGGRKMSPDNTKRLNQILDDAHIRDGTRPCPECKTDMGSADADWLCPSCFLRVPKQTPDPCACTNPVCLEVAAVIERAERAESINDSSGFEIQDAALAPVENGWAPVPGKFGHYTRALTPEETGGGGEADAPVVVPANGRYFKPDVAGAMEKLERLNPKGFEAACEAASRTVTELVNGSSTLKEELLAQREQLAAEIRERGRVCPQASENLAHLYETYKFDEGRAAKLAEYARQAGLWPKTLAIKPGCPCPGCNWGHLSYDLTDKSICCVFHGGQYGCGVLFPASLLAMLQTETPSAIVRAMLHVTQDALLALGKRESPEILRLSFAMGNALERELLLATKIDLPHAREHVRNHPQPKEQLHPGERFLCNFDGTWLIQRINEEEARPERRKSPRYEAPPILREAVPRHGGMATIGDLLRELRKEGLDLLDGVRLNPATCNAIRNALRAQADLGFGGQQIPIPGDIYVGPWFVTLLGGEDKFGRKPGGVHVQHGVRGRDDEWQEEIDRQRVAEAMHKERQAGEFRVRVTLPPPLHSTEPHNGPRQDG
jgi:hypothetical protein